MDRSKDLILRKVIKDWASSSKPPENGRARLLWEAAHATKKKSAISPFIIKLHADEQSIGQSNDWSQTVFFSWVFEHTLQTGVAARLC